MSLVDLSARRLQLSGSDNAQRLHEPRRPKKSGKSNHAFAALVAPEDRRCTVRSVRCYPEPTIYWKGEYKFRREEETKWDDDYILHVHVKLTCDCHCDCDCAYYLRVILIGGEISCLLSTQNIELCIPVYPMTRSLESLKQICLEMHVPECWIPFLGGCDTQENSLILVC